jgi:hypothetical protein
LIRLTCPFSWIYLKKSSKVSLEPMIAQWTFFSSLTEEQDEVFDFLPCRWKFGKQVKNLLNTEFN